MKRVIFLLFLLPLLVACNKESEEFSMEEEIEYPQELNFIYKGVEYSSRCETVDEEWIILDDAVKDLYDSLSENPTLSTVVRGDDVMVFFDNYDEVVEAYDLETEEEDILTRIGSGAVYIYRAQIELYENTDFKKHMVTYETLSRLAVSKLGKQKKLSSFKLQHSQLQESTGAIGAPNPPLQPQESYVTFYDDSQFTGKNITFLKPATFNAKGTFTTTYPNLKKYSRGSKSWNDAACSLIFGFRKVP